MEKSENLDKLFEALSLAQGKIKGAIKDSANPFFKSKYTSLDSCWDAIRLPLSEHGLSVVQAVGEQDGKPNLTIILGHSSGQYISSSMTLSIKSQDSQGISSAISYARRFTLCAMVGITQGDDDDGEKEMESARHISFEQAQRLKDLIGKDTEYAQSLLNWLKIDDFTLMPLARYEKVLESVNRRNQSKAQGA
ncbi:MAG: ERF family protein [Patescibacteria group bacterium]